MKTKTAWLIKALALLTVLLLQKLPVHGQTILGTTDINACLEEAPEVPNSLEEALRRHFGTNPQQPDPLAADRFYKPYESKIEHRLGEYRAYAQQKAAANGASEADYRREAEAMANSNPIVAGMGGYEKVSQMSEADARAAALQASAKTMADPFGGQSAGMTALYQKIVSDPAFAAKFEKMSEAEREAELRKYMATDKPRSKTPAQLAQERSDFEQQQRSVAQIRNAQEIQLKMVELKQKLVEVGADFEAQFEAVRQKSPGTHAEISADFEKKYAQIPLVALGEMREKDPAIERPLRLETARKHRERALAELKQQSVLLAAMSSRYQTIVSEYLDFIGQNGHKVYGGTSTQDILWCRNTELPLVSFEASLIGIGQDLSRYARNLTGEAAAWEAAYLEAKRAR